MQGLDSRQASRERHLFGISAGNMKRVPVTVSKSSILVRHLVVEIAQTVILSDMIKSYDSKTVLFGDDYINIFIIFWCVEKSIYLWLSIEALSETSISVIVEP